LRILIDDERTQTPTGVVPDLIVKNYDAAIDILMAFDELGWLSDDDLYLDHDLGGNETGYDLMCWIEKQGVISNPKRIICVSDNAPGRAKIEQVIIKLYGKLFYD